MTYIADTFNDPPPYGANLEAGHAAMAAYLDRTEATYARLSAASTSHRKDFVGLDAFVKALAEIGHHVSVWWGEFNKPPAVFGAPITRDVVLHMNLGGGCYTHSLKLWFDYDAQTGKLLRHRVADHPPGLETLALPSHTTTYVPSLNDVPLRDLLAATATVWGHAKAWKDHRYTEIMSEPK